MKRHSLVVTVLAAALLSGCASRLALSADDARAWGYEPEPVLLR